MYDINKMPQTQEEYGILINAKLAEEAAKADADPTYTPKTREQLEREYAFLKPQEATAILPFPDDSLLTLDELKQQKLSELKWAFEQAGAKAVVETPWGWPVDAKREDKDNVDSILEGMEATGAEVCEKFCDANNEFHAVTKADMQTIKLLIIQNGSRLYDKKWQIRDAINAASSKEELMQVEIAFQ